MENHLDTKGRIFDIQKFSIHDGPGIRTIVFLKGCVLRCKWCCNPESQEYAVQEMHTEGGTRIIGRDITVREVLEDIKKDMPYYRRSGGGVTLSGGESLCQPDFAVSLLRACKESSINTAMESTGYADFSVIEKYLEYLDLFLMDIKHVNDEKHKQFTTKSNRLILENARKIAETANELIIRIPVIPTFNATAEEISAIAEFAASLPNVRQLHLLPYHSMGIDKYKWLGRKYTLEGIKPPDDEHMQRLLAAAEKFGLKCQIGG